MRTKVAGKRSSISASVSPTLLSNRRLNRWQMSLAVATLFGLVAFVLYFAFFNEEMVLKRSPAPASIGKEIHYAGSSKCMQCHTEQYRQWQASHHQFAMKAPDATSVLGNFNQVRFQSDGMNVLFHSKDGHYYIQTEDAQGKSRDFEVKYTFGFKPLQQYLLEIPGGKLQAFTVAWDARPVEDGGQRWFSLYPGRKVAPGDELHWTGAQQNWNFMCADCHSTNYRKNFDSFQQHYSSTWSEINVGCEACHGPGSQHIDLAKNGKLTGSDSKGLSVRLDERYGIKWSWDESSGKPVRNHVKQGDKEIQVCAQCHSLRSQLADGYAPGKKLLDYYRPALPQHPLFFDDGQQKEEVYTWASFKQSRMYAKGVTCSDCHNPHSNQLRVKGNGVCLQCHSDRKYDSEKHHFHPLGSAGASCTACHMPTRTYMLVDKRHDHAFRIPRPDLTQAHGADRVPNACNSCHQDKSPAWASGAINRWYGTNRKQDFHYLDKVISIQSEKQGVDEMLRVLNYLQTTSLTRVTALSTLAMQHPALIPLVIDQEVKSTDDIARLSAADMASKMPPEARVAYLAPLLDDTRLSVRTAAVLGLLELPVTSLSLEQQNALLRVTKEYREIQEFNADRAEAQTNLGQLETLLGHTEQALQHFNAARKMNPNFTPAYLALAQLYSEQGHEAEANKVLLDAIKIAPENAAAYHAYGLSLVRSDRRQDALKALATAAKLQPENDRYSYVYAIALYESGKKVQSLQVLKRVAEQHTSNREVLEAIIQYSRELGQPEVAQIYATRLQDLKFP